MQKTEMIAAVAFLVAFALLAGCTQTPKACTMEAKICPDGSAVGRSGPNCEFAPCPNGTASNSSGGNGTNYSSITTFDECAAAGYPIMESFPRQCRTPDGRTFVSQSDAFEIGLDTNCTKDDDCMLVDRSLGFGCCWAGRCKGIDYSASEWIAVNAGWFLKGQLDNCPSKMQCGPAPMCATRLINENYTAKCMWGACRKLDNLRGCSDMCGDGVCQEFACEAIGCPCTETEASCQNDCGK